MGQFRIAEAAELLGVSNDTVRRLTESGALDVGTDGAGRKVIPGAGLAAYARTHAHPSPDPTTVARSARNRFVGVVTKIVSDEVMSQVELQCGPDRVVSLMSTEAVNELDLEIGSLAVAVVKATHVLVEAPTA